jgi:hypothetical protein
MSCGGVFPHLMHSDHRHVRDLAVPSKAGGGWILFPTQGRAWRIVVAAWRG